MEHKINFRKNIQNFVIKEKFLDILRFQGLSLKIIIILF